MPPERRPEILEPFHRNCILRGLADRRDTDLVMVSDLDEIPSARAVREYVAGRSRGIAAFEQSLYYYWMDCRMCQCTGTRIATVADARKWTPQRLRHHPEAMATLRKDNEPNWAGWHFSYLGGPQAIRAKTQAFCHPGCAAPNYMNEENLQKCLATGADLYGRGGGHFVELDGSWPEYLLANRERFAHFLSERSRLVSQP
jgi:beta-1,4-mannosyl-glycoprotein beta-1,4-N-acetylglucosaminyltransferase